MTAFKTSNHSTKYTTVFENYTKDFIMKWYTCDKAVLEAIN